MTFFYDPFLGGFGGGGTSQEIAELKAAVFYKDGSASMTGNADYANYAILNLEYLSLNDLLIPPGPGAGELKVYSKASGLLIPDPDSAMFYKAPNGVEVELLHSGSGAGDVIYSGAGGIFPGAEILAVYDTIGTKITDSFIKIPPAVPVPANGDVLSLTSIGIFGQKNLGWTTPGGGGNVSGSAPTTIGNLSEWTDAGGTQISDSLVVAAEVVQNPLGVGVNGNLAQFGATPEQITDSGVAVLDVGDVKSSTNPSVNNAAVVYDSTSGKLIKEGGVITISGDEIATTVSGFPARLHLSAGTGGGGSYGGIFMNYVTALAPPGGQAFVGIVTGGPDTGALQKIDPASLSSLIGLTILNNNPSPVRQEFQVPSNQFVGPVPPAANLFGIPSANWSVQFSVPSACTLVKLSCQTQYRKGGGASGVFYTYANLSSTYPAFTPLAGGGANGVMAFQMDESDDDGATISWLINGSTLGWAAGSTQTIWIGFSTTSSTIDLTIAWGGDGTGAGGYPDASPPTFISVEALPNFVNILP